MPSNVLSVIMIVANILGRIEMKKRVSFGVFLCLLFLVSACNEGSPTTPTPTPGPAGPAGAVGITVLSTKVNYLIGETETFTASLRMSDGTSVPITGGTWRSDTEAVASVDNAGLVTVVGDGWVNVSCTFQGRTGFKGVRGMWDCQGSWTGTYSIDSCRCSGDFESAGFCATQGGSGYPVELHVEMADEEGTIRLGGLSGTLVDSMDIDGTSILLGQVSSAPYTIRIEISTAWTDSGPSFPGMILEYTATGMKGEAYVYCTFSSLTKTGD